jgi:hypothetical protein
MRNDGGPAFPHCAELIAYGDKTITKRQITDNGMTLRDYFAAKAMQSLLQTLAAMPADARPSAQASSEDFAALAGLSYKMARSMLKARE